MTRRKSADPRPLIVGATGQVGAQMLHFLRASSGPDGALPTARTAQRGWLQLNLAQLTSVQGAAEILNPYPLTAIFCIAGMTNVDACEGAPDLAHYTNARGPAVLAAYAYRLRVPFVYFSSEYIFDGSPDQPGPYTEGTVPHPINVYGKSKRDGEYGVLDAHPEALVIRTTVVYGSDPRHKNYLYSLMRNLSKRTPMQVPSDQISTPTYNYDLSVTALGLVKARASGVFHVCGPQLLSRFEFARQVAFSLGMDPLLLTAVPTDSLGQSARRPLFGGLSTSKLTTLYPDLSMSSLAEGLLHCDGKLKFFLNRESLRK